MYKKALAGKIASNAARDIDSSCSPGGMTAWTSLKIFFQSAFSTDDDVCTKYHENILVDPFFEVTPLQVRTRCNSRTICFLQQLYNDLIYRNWSMNTLNTQRNKLLGDFHAFLHSLVYLFQIYLKLTRKAYNSTY